MLRHATQRFMATASAAALSLMIGATAHAAPGRSLYADVKAAAVGDLITVVVVESTQASRSESTQTSKRSGVSGAFALKTGATGGTNINGGLNTATEHDGGGSTTSSGVLRTTVTATVTEVMPGGNLKIQGTRELVINSEKETLTVSGTVRFHDITKNNTILSNQLADASISYTGDGWIAKQNKPNIFVRILSSILPFF